MLNSCVKYVNNLQLTLFINGKSLNNFFLNIYSCAKTMGVFRLNAGAFMYVLHNKISGFISLITYFYTSSTITTTITTINI